MLKRFVQFLAPFVVLLFVAFPAHAQSAIEGQDWWQVKPPSGNAEADAVYVKIAPGINLQTPTFIRAVNEKFKFDPPLDQLALREENRDLTIALCHTLGDGFADGKIRSFEERRIDRAWFNCKPEDGKERYVYVLPGTVIKLRGRHVIPPDKKLELADQIGACKDAECVKRIAAQLGATTGDNAAPPPAGATPPSGNTTPPSSDGSLVTELKKCYGNFSCVIGALRGNGIKVVVPEAKAEQSEAPKAQDNFWLILALVSFIGLSLVLAIVLYVVHRRAAVAARFSTEKIGELQTDLAHKEDAVASLKGQLDTAKSATKSSDERLRSVAAAMQVVTDAMVKCAKRWNVVIPATYKQLELFNLISGHLDEVYVQIAQANRGKDEAEKKVKGLLSEVTQRNDEVEALQKTLDEKNLAEEKDRKHCAELYEILNAANADLILIDNETTDLHGPYGELKARFAEAQQNDPANAPDLRYQLDACETRFTELAQDRMKVVDRKAAAQAEFDVLFKRLAGFEFTEAKLYAEAQRDRNDAATELGKARLTARYAQAQQDRLSVLEADLGEREIEIKAREAAVAITEAEQARRQTELDTREADSFELNLKWREIMGGLLALLGYDPNKMTLEEIIAIDGSKGVINKARVLLEEAGKRLRDLDPKVTALEADLAAQREASRVAIAENFDLRAKLHGMVERFARYSVALELSMAQRKSLRQKLGKATAMQKRLERQFVATTTERDTLVETVASLEAQLEDARTPAFPKPSPVPQIVSTPPAATGVVRRMETQPYSPAFDAKAVQETFFNTAEVLLKDGGALLLNSARKVWILFELTRLGVMFDFAGIFPAGTSPSNSSALGLPKTKERLGRASFCQEDLKWFIDLFEPQPPDLLRPAVARASGFPR